MRSPRFATAPPKRSPAAACEGNKPRKTATATTIVTAAVAPITNGVESLSPRLNATPLLWLSRSVRGPKPTGALSSVAAANAFEAQSDTVTSAITPNTLAVWLDWKNGFTA